LINIRTIIIFFIVSIIFTTVFFCQNTGAAPIENGRIVILTSYESKEYIEVRNSIEDFFSSKDVPLKTLSLSLQGNRSNATEIIPQIKNHKPKLIICLGSLATDVVNEQIKDISILSAMVLKEANQNKEVNITYFFLEHSLDTHLKWMQRFLPDAKKIGVLYNSKLNKDLIDKAGKLFKKNGLTLIPYEIKNPKDIPYALNILSRKIDVLWGINDNFVFSKKTAKNILLFSFRNRIPLIGMSDPWVKAGALYALSWDYEEVGKECGEKALKIIQKKTVDSTYPRVSQNIKYSLNSKTAERMGVKIPETLIKDAKTIY
jgi:putative ABC transport system substrate-binding protein